MRNLLIRLMFGFLLLAVPVLAQSTYDGITIPATHPTLWETPGNAAQITAWCAAHPFTPKSRDWLGMAFHDLCTGTTTYTATWYAWVSSSAVQSSMTTSAGDYARWRGNQLIVGFDWEYNNLTSAERSTLISDNNTWISYWETQCYGGAIGEDRCTINYEQDNYFWGFTRNELAWGIATYNDQTATAQGFIDDALKTRWANAFVPSVTATSAGGVFQQGDEYGCYLATYPLIPWITAKSLGRDLYSEANPFWQSAVMYLIYSTSQEKVEKIIGGVDKSESFWELSTFDDDEYFDYWGTAESLWNMNQGGNGSCYASAMDAWANYYSTIPIGQYAKEWLNTTNLPKYYYISAVDNSSRIIPLAFSNLPLDYYATGPEYLFGHSAWGKPSTDFFLQLGSNSTLGSGVGGHHHEDEGTWQLRRNGSSGRTAYCLSRETVSYGNHYTHYQNPAQWAVMTGYTAGIWIIPSPPNGHAYEETVSSCTSGSSTPTWPTRGFGTASDGTCVWVLNADMVFDGDFHGSNTTATKNGILINGRGTNYDAYGANAQAMVYRLESQPNYAYADDDITDRFNKAGDIAYRNNPAAGHVEREFLFIRPLETLVILDRLVASNFSGTGFSIPAARIYKTFIAHCEVNWTIEDSTHETCTNGNDALRITNLEPTSFRQRVVNESSCPNAKKACAPDGQYRLELDTSGAAQQYFLNVLQARDSTGSNLTASVVDSAPADPTSGTFTVTLQPSVGNATTIVFNKTACAAGVGECSSGGSINVAGTGSVNLRTNVEPISYTNNGPVWHAGSPPIARGGIR